MTNGPTDVKSGVNRQSTAGEISGEDYRLVTSWTAAPLSLEQH